MCATVVYGLLGGLAAYILVTAAAFAYLPWWQAVLASAGFFALEVVVGRYLVKRFVRRVGSYAREAFDLYGQVMKGAGVDVHSVRAPGTGSPAPALAQGKTTYAVEFTVFPPDPNQRWEPAGLKFVPDGAADALVPDGIRLVEGETDAAVEQSVTGARRLRATLDVPAGVSRLSVRYGLADFGSIDLTKLTPVAGRDL